MLGSGCLRRPTELTRRAGPHDPLMGSIDTSPAWKGQRPNAAQRARYRQFADSLSDELEELRRAIAKRACQHS